MSLAGRGAVAIWHDIAPQARDEFYAWHGGEHMPERLAIPGFLRGRRYAAHDETSPEYFNLYETVSRFTLTGADYLARLNAPTPWTAATIRHFTNVSRSLCEVAASFGEGQGGLIATLRYGVADARAAAHRTRMTQIVLPALAARAGVAGCHLLLADAAASAVETAERKARVEKNLVPGTILLVEGWGDVAPFEDLCREFLAGDAFAEVAAAPLLGIYRLQNSRTRLP